ncbi:MAG: tetratricopeptide repeat protein [Halofilum sp. (in: g-proteobacteria)]|nr:tetratricopeptide repeat protein [Halofilum sp. (in: g-proteobacteria)]
MTRLRFLCLIAALLSGAGCATGGGNDSRAATGEQGLLELVDESRRDYEAGRYSAARQKLERVLEQAPDDAGIHTRAANAAYREGRYEIAASHYTKALRLTDVPLPRVRYNLAMVRLSQAAAELGYLERGRDGEVLEKQMGDLLDALYRHTGRPAPVGLASGVDGKSGD